MRNNHKNITKSMNLASQGDKEDKLHIRKMIVRIKNP